MFHLHTPLCKKELKSTSKKILPIPPNLISPARVIRRRKRNVHDEVEDKAKVSKLDYIIPTLPDHTYAHGFADVHLLDNKTTTDDRDHLCKPYKPRITETIRKPIKSEPNSYEPSRTESLSEDDPIVVKSHQVVCNSHEPHNSEAPKISQPQDFSCDRDPRDIFANHALVTSSDAGVTRRDDHGGQSTQDERQSVPLPSVMPPFCFSPMNFLQPLQQLIPPMFGNQCFLFPQPLLALNMLNYPGDATTTNDMFGAPLLLPNHHAAISPLPLNMLYSPFNSVPNTPLASVTQTNASTALQPETTNPCSTGQVNSMKGFNNGLTVNSYTGLEKAFQTSMGPVSSKSLASHVQHMPVHVSHSSTISTAATHASTLTSCTLNANSSARSSSTLTSSSVISQPSAMSAGADSSRTNATRASNAELCCGRSNRWEPFSPPLADRRDLPTTSSCTSDWASRARVGSANGVLNRRDFPVATTTSSSRRDAQFTGDEYASHAIGNLHDSSSGLRRSSLQIMQNRTSSSTQCIDSALDTGGGTNSDLSTVMTRPSTSVVSVAHSTCDNSNDLSHKMVTSSSFSSSSTSAHSLASQNMSSQANAVETSNAQASAPGWFGKGIRYKKKRY